MRPLAIILALLAAAPAAAASHVPRDPDMRTARQAKMRPLRWASPVASRYRFESTGSDWRIGTDPVPEPTIDCRPADLIPPQMDKFREEIKEYIEQDEDVLSYAIFPQVALDIINPSVEQTMTVLGSTDPVPAVAPALAESGK